MPINLPSCTKSQGHLRDKPPQTASYNWNPSGSNGLYGGEGADQITGGKDRDRYYYTSASESTTALRDTVKFAKEDRFVFSSFDTDATTEAQQKLSFIGKQAFSGIAGELRATRSVLEADTNGDGLADFAVNLRSNTLITANNLTL